MKPVIKCHIIIFIIFFAISGLQARQIKPDNRSVKRIEIPEKHLNKYRNNKAFDYVIKAKKDNAVIKAIKWIKQKIYNLFAKFFSWLFGEKKGMKLLKILIEALPYIAVLIFTYLIFRFLIGVDLIRLGRKKQVTKSKVINLNDEEIIKEADLDSLINEAVNEKDYRLAIRYYYLKTLKELMNHQLIEWHPDKTNRDYVNELKINKLKDIFKHLTFIYDYVWYGKFVPAEEDFVTIKNDFNKFVIK